MVDEFRNHGFVLSWTQGDSTGNSVAGPFNDASQDLLDLELTKLGQTNYQARVRRIVGGFSNPIDAVESIAFTVGLATSFVQAGAAMVLGLGAAALAQGLRREQRAKGLAGITALVAR